MDVRGIWIWMRLPDIEDMTRGGENAISKPDTFGRKQQICKVKLIGQTPQLTLQWKANCSVR